MNRRTGVLIKNIDGSYRYGPYGIPRRQKAPVRVQFALHRLSRGKWLSPDEVTRIGLRLAACCSHQPWRTLEAAVGLRAMHAVGLLDGRLAVYPDSPIYRKAVEVATNKKRFKNGATRELQLLNLILQENHERSDSYRYLW